MGTPYQNISYSIENFVGTLVLNRPPVNALGKDLLTEIRLAAEQAVKDADAKLLRVLVIRGEGANFSAGADLKERLATPQDKVEEAVRHINRSINTVGRIPVPVIALVQGVAMGGGLELALAADIRVMTETAKVGLRETALAIIPGAGGTQRLPRIVGYSKAMLWIASARAFTGKEAHAHGVADILTTDADLVTIGMQLAGEIAANGPLAVRQAKLAVNASFDLALKDGLTKEVDCYLPVIPSKDRREGLAAFNEKRKPMYMGE